jgi:serine/threonine-protein kinase
VTDLARLNSALVGRYTVEREVGAGGMATVYLAQDLKHHRKVALKVLRAEIAATLGAERFSREIEVAAQLQHPHILPLLDSGEADGFYYYVMPFVEGESLRDRLAHHGELPVHDAVKVLIEVVDALVHAHAHGVVHRDIKPDNILMSGRHALVMDFGVAKAVSEATGAHTLTSVGIALGTPAYMAPEQAAADPNIDHRVDLYAVGVLGYELLTGRPPFSGLTPQETLAAHVTQAPEPVERRRPGISPALSRVLMKCLAKRPADRWQTADELLAQLEPLATPSGGTTPTMTMPVAAITPRPRWVMPAIGAAAAILLTAVGLVLFCPTPKAPALGKVTQLTFEPGLEIEPAISPDGKFVAYAAGPLADTRVYVRQRGGRPVALVPDSGPPQRRPLWSPDGTRILFETDADLFVMPALGGAPRIMAKGACCAAWSPDGRQVAYVRSPRRFGNVERPESIYVAPLDGGPSRFVGLVFDPHSLTWSPDGRWLALVSGNDAFAVGTQQFGNKGPSAVVLVPAVGGAPVPVTDNASLNMSPVWTPDSRRMLFVSDREGARDVYAVRLANSGIPAGKPSRITTGLNAHSISLSADGTRQAYSVYASRANVWAIPIPTGAPVSVDRATQVTTGNQTVERMALSPDGRWLYFDSDRSGNADIYRMLLSGGEPEQLTTDLADDFLPNVSPDGRWVAFHALRFGTRDIFVMPAEGGEVERVTSDPGEERAPTWSPDGRSLSYFLSGTGARDGLYVISKDQSGRWGSSRQVWNHPWVGTWSPDGRTLVSGWTAGIWLIPAAGGAPRRVTQLPETISGPEPPTADWSRDGRTIYFKASDRGGRASIWALAATSGRAHLLVRFDDPARPSYNTYSFATDGRRFYFTINDRQSDIYVAELQGLR